MLQDYSEHLRKLRDQLALTPTTVSLENRGAPFRSPSTQSLLEPKSFEDERNQLLQFARVQQLPQLLPTPAPLQMASERPLERLTTSEKYKEILREVERLSDTVAALHRERAELDEQSAQRVRQMRAELEAKEQQLDDAAMRRTELEQQVADMKAQTIAVRRELQRQIKELEEVKSSLATSQANRAQLDETCRELDHAHQIIASLERQLREKDMQLAAAGAAATEWEKRFNSVSRSRAAETDDMTKANKRLGEAARSALHWTGQLSHALSKLGEAVEVSGDGHEDLGSSLALLESQLDDIGTAYGQDLQQAKTKVSTLVNHCVETVHRRFILNVAKLDSTMTEASHLRESLRRSESKCEQLAADLSQFVSTADEQSTLIDKLRRREKDLSDAFAQLQNQFQVADAASAAQRTELEDQVDAQVLELHQQRMRVNELEAQITRITSQRMLQQEDSQAVTSQLRQSLQQKDALLAKLRAENDALRAQQAPTQISDESSIIAIEEFGLEAEASNRSATGAVNDDLRSRLEAVEQATSKLKTERDAAVTARETQDRLIKRQEETIMDLLSRLQGGTPPPQMRVTGSRTPTHASR
jgi:septal ring factor EnvC (AmiA/AmiB activator)